MKKTFALVAVAVVSTTRCFPGALADDPRTFPALITHAKGTASGCFFQLSNSVYLVTARHVLFETNAPTLLSATALVKAYSRSGTTNVSERIFKLDLAQLLDAGEIRFSTNRDVALVRVEQCKSNDANVVAYLPGVTPLSQHSGLNVRGPAHACPINEADVGADVFMFGYPISLTDPISSIFDPSEPLLRKGTIAGVNLQRRTIIIDCPAYFGNSGGPVLQVEHPSLGITRFRVVGLVSAFVPFLEEWENKTMGYSHVIKSNSGYTVVEPIDIALELVWK